jgi:transcriptional regulator with XRE-family HTH domain
MPIQEVASPIDLNLPEKLEDREYRRQFFWAETSAGIARDLIKLRKLRGHSQKQLADLTGTKQPAISRIEQADYENWNLRTLRTIADVEDARIRVIIEPAEDVLSEYGSSSDIVQDAPGTVAAGNAETVTAEDVDRSLDVGRTLNLGFGKTGAVVLRQQSSDVMTTLSGGTLGADNLPINTQPTITNTVGLMDLSDPHSPVFRGVPRLQLELLGQASGS